MSDSERASYIRALAGLDGHQRRVFSRRFELGLTYEAISDELGGKDSAESLRAIVKDALAGLAESMTGTRQPPTGLDGVLESLVDDGPADWAGLASNSDPGARAVLSALRAIDSFSGENRPSTPPDGVDVDSVDWPGIEITSRLGAGAFGQVFRAWDPTLERAVALKLSHGALASTRDQTRLQQEARHLAQLRHPNIVAVYGVEEHGGRLGIQMELIEGETLAQTMDNGRTLSSEEAASIGIKLCQALAAAGAKELIHSDIKAQNVMRETGGRIVLMDFGAARFKPSSGADTSGAAAGTPLYMAPELFEGGAPTPASDIFALGVLLFHLVTNRFPVEATSVAGIREQHARFQRILLRDLRPDLSERFVEVVEQALARAPGARHGTPGQLERDLAETLPVDRPRMSRPVMAATAVFGVLLGLGALGALETLWFRQCFNLPPEYADDGPMTYLYWGARSIFPILAYWAALALVVALIIAVGSLLGRRSASDSVLRRRLAAIAPADRCHGGVRPGRSRLAGDHRHLRWAVPGALSTRHTRRGPGSRVAR